MPTNITGSSVMMVSYEWVLENIEKDREIISTQTILFHGEKIFRVCIKNQKKNKPIVIFLVANLNSVGMQVKEVRYGKQDSESNQKMEEKEVGNKEKDAKSIQFFTADLTEMVVGKCTFVFSIWMEGSVSSYSYQLSDRLVKNQLWDASVKNQYWTDVEFVCEDRTFAAHKAILAARSPVLAEEFTKEYREEGDGPHQIRIDDVDPATVEEFLYFVYTGEPKTTSLAKEKLLKLASRYQITTLVNLCQSALKKIDAQQLMSCITSINPEANTLHTECNAKPRVLTWPDKETEIFYDTSASTFQCCWDFEVNAAALSPNAVIEYLYDRLFSPHLTGKIEGNARFGVIEKPWIHLICMEHGSLGFEVTEVLYSTGMFYLTDFRKWIKMKPKKVDNVDLFLFMAQTVDSLPFYQRQFSFCIKMKSKIENYSYEMMDTLWMTELWQAAVDQRFTDVEIFVGSDKVMEAHKVVLAARSPVLNAMVDKAINGTEKSVVTFDASVNRAILEQFLKFLYTGSLGISPNNKKLLKLAEEYKVETLSKVSELATRQTHSAAGEVTEFLVANF